MTEENEIEAETIVNTEEAEAEKEVVEESETAKEAKVPASEESEVEELERLRAELEEARAEAEEYLDGWRRSQAEFSNYKKRQRAEQARVRERANADLLRKLLPVLDDLERALKTMPEALHKLSWSGGLLMIKRKLDAILESEGIEPVKTEGKKFDPRYHEAVTHEEVEGYDEGDIIGEVQQGYMLGDRVLRPALVRVAKTTAERPDEEEAAEVSETEDEE